MAMKVVRQARLELSGGSTPDQLRPPLAGAVGSSNHRAIGGEVDWRPPLLYVYPLGHRVPATLKDPRNFTKLNAKDRARCVCFPQSIPGKSTPCTCPGT